MKALIIKGKHKGKVVEISQWCNDWFTVDTGDIDIDRKPFSPSSLAFTILGMDEIIDHKNNGMLFSWFETATTPSWCGIYRTTFKKRRLYLKK